MQNQILQPIYDRIIVKPLPKEEKTAGGLFIPGNAQEDQDRGTVLITGKGRKDKNGKLIPMHIKVGDVVIYGQNIGLSVSHDGHTDCLVMNEDDVIAVLEK